MRFGVRIIDRLYLSFFAILLIPSLIIGIVSYNAAQKQVKSSLQSAAKASLNLFNQSMTDFFTARQQDVDNLVLTLGNQSFVPDNGSSSNSVTTILANFAATHPSFLHVYVGTDKGYFVQRPYTSMPAGYDPRQRPWYQQALAHAGQVVITSPYKDASTGSMVVTIAKSLPGNQGVLGVDIRLTELTQMAQQVQLPGGGFLTLFTPTGSVVADPELAAGALLTSAQPEMKPVLNGNQGDFAENVAGQSRDVRYQVNPLTQWRLAAVIPVRGYTQTGLPIRNVLLWTLAISTLLGMVLIYFIVQSITKPLGVLVDTARKIGQGSLTHRARVFFHDEIGLLTQALNEMADSLQGLAQNVTDTAQQVAQASQELAAGSEQTTQSVQQVAVAMQEVSNGSGLQQQGSEQASMAMQQMAAGIQSVADSANTVAQNAAGMAEQAHVGNERMLAAVGSMSEVTTSVAASAQHVETLSQRSQRIEEMSKVITGIAAQTNLLALNAAIEAARAGSEGRGFAVVASEVRKLAQQSADAAKEITQVVSQIAADVEHLVESAQTVQQGVSTTVQTLHVSATDFAQIVTASQQIAGEIQGVSAAVEQMSATSEQVSATVSEISTIATNSAVQVENVAAAVQQQMASMEEISASAGALSVLAEHLNGLVGEFKL
ncbi:methyl-accepting chemotaxis protein [Alicyclobacillaceae bacterium I2511]|nr:methyl-accepting chemotaxis protein [Alicyclobacillaceae bacterium I2511]